LKCRLPVSHPVPNSNLIILLLRVTAK